MTPFDRLDDRGNLNSKKISSGGSSFQNTDLELEAMIVIA